MWNIEINGSKEVWVYQKNAETFERKFIGRFKYANPRRSANHFVKFLKANFTPEEYFGAYAEGKAPVTILKEKGFVSYNVMQYRVVGLF